MVRKREYNVKLYSKLRSKFKAMILSENKERSDIGFIQGKKLTNLRLKYRNSNMSSKEMNEEMEKMDIKYYVKSKFSRKRKLRDDKKYIKALKDSYIKYNGDIEVLHREYDRTMCKLLIEMGYVEFVKEYEKTIKWYA